MSSLPSKEKNTSPFTIVDLPLAFIEYDFDCSVNKLESVILTFLTLKHEIANKKGVTDAILRQIAGSRYRTYLDMIINSGINPLMEFPEEETGKYWFRCESAKKGYKKLLEFVGDGGK